jgi:hypothetical protein
MGETTEKRLREAVADMAPEDVHAVTAFFAFDEHFEQFGIVLRAP